MTPAMQVQAIVLVGALVVLLPIAAREVRHSLTGRWS